MGLGLEEIRFRSNVHSGKCIRYIAILMRPNVAAVIFGFALQLFLTTGPDCWVSVELLRAPSLGNGCSNANTLLPSLLS